MAFEQINDYAPGAIDLENVTETVDVQRRGYEEITLTEFDQLPGTTVPEVVVGSTIDINGTLYELQAANASISGTITTYPKGNIPLSFVGDAGSPIQNRTSPNYIVMDTTGANPVPTWTTTAPAWDAAKGGWYSGSDKYLPYIVDAEDDAGTVTYYITKMEDDNTNIRGRTSYNSSRMGSKPVWPAQFGNGSLTNDQVYEMIKNIVPNVGDIVPVSGACDGINSNEVHVFSYMERISSTTIRFYVCTFFNSSGNISGSNSTLDVVDGDSSFSPVRISTMCVW